MACKMELSAAFIISSQSLTRKEYHFLYAKYTLGGGFPEFLDNSSSNKGRIQIKSHFRPFDTDVR